MRSRWFPLVFLVVAFACAEPPRERPRNVLLLVVDTLRADRLGCYGYPRRTSPRIDRLAARGTLYRDNRPQSCWTVPSMISLMSGVWVTQSETALPRRFPVLAETLKEHGLETAAFIANPTLTLERGFERGFDRFESVPQARGDEVADAFRRWYRARAEATPFFAWVQFIDPHQPYAPERRHQLFHGPREDLGRLTERWRAALPELARYTDRPPGLEFEEAVELMNLGSNLYDGEVRAADEGVGKIVDLLERAGELDRTLVIVCSDHGEMLFEHRKQPRLVTGIVEKEGRLPEGVRDLFGAGHRPWYYEELWRTPLVLSGPGVPAGEARDGLAANLDVYPTILDALGIDRRPHLQGESLAGGAVPGRRHVFAHGHGATAVVDDAGTKLVVQPRDLYLLGPEDAEPELLFDVRDDPYEDRDLVSERRELRDRLRAAIDRWREMNTREVETDTTPEQLEVLREMGYVGE